MIWGWTFVATKVCLQYVGPVELLAARLAIAVPVLAALVRWRGASLEFGAGRRAVMVASALFTAHFLVQISGLVRTTATRTGWIIAVTPLVLAVAARVLLGERSGPRTRLAVMVASCGIVLLVSGGRLGNLAWLRSVGDWLILASAHTWALYTIAVRDVARLHDPLAVTLAVVLPGAVATNVWVALGPGFGGIFSMKTDGLVALAYLAVLGTAAAQAFWQMGVARLGATRAGTFLYLEPLATTALAVPYLGEPFGTATLVGGAMVLAGVAWAQTERPSA